MGEAASAVVLAGRLVFAVFFVAVAGLGHIRRDAVMRDYARHSGFPAPSLAGWPAGLWLVAGGLSVGLGAWADVGALMIAAFVIPAAYWFHRFWAVEEPQQRQLQMQLFFRNLVFFGAALALFGFFAGLGEGLGLTLTGPLLELD